MGSFGLLDLDYGSAYEDSEVPTLIIGVPRTFNTTRFQGRDYGAYTKPPMEDQHGKNRMYA